ncbi:hypothetical protein PHJA_002390200 [Phtheirospermum japonicum]|uniref:Uncharacterized protein n=1 Tax=Phtheirospermum japonicum TaxID=374723 RepID=A0A830CW03_9LAMI|nr:hypothetical protein PHJA_002390200 [Phtheirospermum japonicum]
MDSAEDSLRRADGDYLGGNAMRGDPDSPHGRVLRKLRGEYWVDLDLLFRAFFFFPVLLIRSVNCMYGVNNYCYSYGKMTICLQNNSCYFK